jgi:putative nucleotidyltransferase with HDIG domain
MDVHTLPDAAEIFSHELPRLARCVVDRLGDTTAAEQASAETLLDRLCLSVRLSKSVGLGGWAEREERRIGSARVVQIIDAAIAVLITEATMRFKLDHVRLQLLLDAARVEIVAPIAGEAAVRLPAEELSSHAESTTLLLSALSERDPQTCGHSKAVGEWARRVARVVGMPDEEVAFIELCGVLHDVGKISTPDAILFKLKPLTEDEWQVMRDHAAAGQRILQQIPSLRHCALIVRAHHERFDGTGYPDGLIRTAIPTAARVVAVADAFHTMISDRPYQRAMTPWKACDVLRAGAGTQWDPRFVDGMLRLFHRDAELHVRKTRVS